MTSTTMALKTAIGPMRGNYCDQDSWATRYRYCSLLLVRNLYNTAATVQARKPTRSSCAAGDSDESRVGP